MKLLLISDEGRQLACVDDVPNAEERNPAQVFALLDLVERLLESASRSHKPVASLESVAATDGV